MNIAPRWKKMFRDMVGDRGRAIFLLITVSVGIFGVSTILSAYSILSREMLSNYMGTNPASATIDVGAVTDADLATAKNFPGIADAEARTVLHARVKIGDDWRAMLLFVIDDFNDMRLNTFRKISGAWPPPVGTMLVERTAIRVLGKGQDGSVVVKTPHGQVSKLLISGVVHDATLAPAWQEETGYGYITRQTLTGLGEAPVLEELRIQLDGNPANLALIESTTQALAILLREQGTTIHELRIPPPRTHPHQTQMTGVMFLFISFSVMALLLSAVLVATVVAAMLTKQVREIGIMKAVGARSGQIAPLYVLMLLLLGGLSTAIGVPAGIAAAWPFADMVANLLNLDVSSYRIDTWVYAVLIGSGLLVPVAVALPTIIKGSRLTVREAITDFGVSATSFGEGRFDTALSALRGIGLPYLLAIRNMFRRRARLILALTLLAVGGSMFITGLNIRDGWEKFVERVYTDRFYDVEFVLNDAIQMDRIKSVLNTVPGIRKTEYWGYAATAIAHVGKIDVSRTYPDGGHGSFALMGPPADTEMIRFPLLAGRWLKKGDTSAVVINQSAKAMMPLAKIGDEIVLSLEGQPHTWILTGIVEEIGSAAVAYVTDRAYDGVAGTAGTAQMLRIDTATGNPAERANLIRNIDDALLNAGISVKKAVPLVILSTAMGAHVKVLVNMLIATSVLLALIGLLGLTSTMTMNVIERTREIGIMRATGATPKVILQIIVSEGMAIGLMSWVLSIALSVPLTVLIGTIVGNMSFKTPVPLTISQFAVAFWLVMVVILAALATMAPARRATRRAVHEALAYE